jgi:hypothetical protein
MTSTTTTTTVLMSLPPESPSPCDCETGIGAQPGERLSSAESLRSTYVTNAHGELVPMSALLGGSDDSTAARPPTLLVFLRHLG